MLAAITGDMNNEREEVYGIDLSIQCLDISSEVQYIGNSGEER